MPRVITWGKYADQREELIGEGGLQDRALNDFQFMRRWIVETLTSQEKMDQQRVEMKQTREWEAGAVDKEAAKAEMGRWMADYLDDAVHLPAFFPSLLTLPLSLLSLLLSFPRALSRCRWPVLYRLQTRNPSTPHLNPTRIPKTLLQGYDNWATYPTIYKAMFMNAFPAIGTNCQKSQNCGLIFETCC